MSVSRTHIFFTLFLGIIVVSFASIIIRVTPAPTPVIAAGRMLFASFIITPFFLKNLRRSIRELTPFFWPSALTAGIFLSGHFVLWIESLKHTTVVSSVVLVAMNPIFVAILALPFLKERLSLRGWIAIFIALAGAFLVAGPTLKSTSLTTGNLLSLGGALCAAGYVLLGRKLRPQISLINYIYPVYTFAALILLLFALISRVPLLGYTTKTYLLIFLLALGPQIIGHTIFNWALKFLPAPVVAISILGEPVGTTILSALLLRQPPTILELSGGLLICLGIYLVASKP
ncbi:MAG: DMT family transporter [Candidatus Aminicenantales bacterium]